MEKHNLLSEYHSNIKVYELFAKSLQSLITSILLNEKISYHSISSRVKDPISLEDKITRKDSYQSIDEITDVIGVRIITNYSDEVDVIAKIIEREFSIDFDNSIDKRESLAPDSFGYLSLHYIISLSKSRIDLSENRSYKKLKAEIQIRSILQHTWAEIEHDTGYKSTVEVPKHIRRQFSRLAGLLEIADEQFVNIRNALTNYEGEVAEIIKENKNNPISLDKISYKEYLLSSQVATNIRMKVKEAIGVELKPYIDKNYGNSALRQLAYHNINTTQDFDHRLRENEKFVIERAKRALSKENDTSKNSAPIEIIGVYLSQALSARNGDSHEIKSFLDSVLTKTPVLTKNILTKKLLDIYKHINN